MARMADIPEPNRVAIEQLECPVPGGAPWVVPKPLARSRVAILTSAALHPRSQLPFPAGTSEFRTLSADVDPAELVMSHVSINFDRTGFQRDINTVYPIDRLRALAADGVVGSVAQTHYSVMGSTDPTTMTETADGITAHLQQEGVDALLLCPV